MTPCALALLFLRLAFEHGAHRLKSRHHILGIAPCTGDGLRVGKDADGKIGDEALDIRCLCAELLDTQGNQFVKTVRQHGG